MPSKKALVDKHADPLRQRKVTCLGVCRDHDSLVETLRRIERNVEKILKLLENAK